MTSDRSPTMARTRPPHVWRLALQILTALLITLPALVNASAGRGSYIAAVLVFAVALSAVWIVCAVGLWLMPAPDVSPPSPSPGAAPTNTPPTASANAAGHLARPNPLAQPLARIPVARVPADQAVHADVNGHVTAATSTMGVVR